MNKNLDLDKQPQGIQRFVKNGGAILFLFYWLIGGGCKEEDKTMGMPPMPIKVQVVAGTPTRQAMQASLSMNGVTMYQNSVNIRATVTGFVEEVKVELGSKISAGQEVFKLKTKEAAALGEEILSDTTLNITGILPIYAKQEGIIMQVFFQDGDYVSEGDVLAEVVKPSSLVVKLYVPFEYNQEVKRQKQVIVRLPDGELLKGTIQQVLPSAEVVSQTTPYLVKLSAYRFLPENLNVTVSVPTHSNAHALTVPRQAVQSNEEQTSFWVMKLLNDSLAVRQEVELGMRMDTLIELKNSALTPNDLIIIQGAYGLPDTAAITLVKQL